jgi:phosphate transport system substrate-binding protein
MPAHDRKPGYARNATVSVIAVTIIALALAAGTSTTTTDSATVMPAAASPGASAVTITGSGSTFDAPFFDLAFARYHQQHPAVTVRYSAMGSSAGIIAFSAKQVNFGASDVPLTAAEQAAAHGGASVQVPVDLGAEVVVYNLVCPAQAGCT